MQRSLLVLSALALLAGCGRAAGGVAPDAAFVSLDGDGDGRLSLAESRMSGLAFAQLDRNTDGAVDVLEWQGADGEAAVVWQVQQQREERRDVTRQDRTGATERR